MRVLVPQRRLHDNLTWTAPIELTPEHDGSMTPALRYPMARGMHGIYQAENAHIAPLCGRGRDLRRGSTRAARE